MASEEKALQVKEPELIVPASIEKTLEALKRFQEFKNRALNEEDYINISGKKFIKKSGWLKYALACSLSLEKREERQEIRPDGEVIYHYTYRAIAPNGRFADAVGSASSDEREFAHETHDVRALAQTRALERAVSNLIGGGELGAEEVEAKPVFKTFEVPKPSPEPKELASDQQVKNIVALCRKVEEKTGWDPMNEILNKYGVRLLTKLDRNQANESIVWLENMAK
jgi:hypothetical protein